MFVNARTSPGAADVPVVVPKEAVQMMGENTVVFVETDHGFEPRPVIPGESDNARVEIVSGLAPGERYVARGGFELKAMLVVSGLGSHAGHGH
jgi:cobalt-zinc-cadmium efflux system membrane fusion protein